jgi:hypothetical protein
MLLKINYTSGNMLKKYFPVFFFLLILIFFSCTGQNNAVFIPVPDAEYYKNEKEIIDINNITETRDGGANISLPDWLRAFFNGGIEEVEKINSYYGKFVFIARNEGINFSALNIWANNFSQVKDFSIFAARRIENRLILSASLYPDDEYGMFYETMVKKAYSAEYSGAQKEDTYWVKFLNNDDNISNTEIYNFFILLTIDKIKMESAVSGMMAETIAVVTPTDAQRISINRLRQYFYQGF